MNAVHFRGMRGTLVTTSYGRRLSTVLRIIACAAGMFGALEGTATSAREVTISGCVSRGDGGAVPDAVVSIFGPTRERSRTDARGCYTIAAALGESVLRVEASGFEPFVRPNVRAGTRLDITLATAASSLVTIGRASVDGRRGVSTASAASTTHDAQLASRRGTRSIAELLANDLSLTAVRPLGGGANAPGVFALRGPDPTETLVMIDGHEVNNSNTGDFDLARLSPDDFQSVEVVYGIAPSSLVGPNTLGGAINLQTLEPTAAAHGLVRLRAGSYGEFGATLQGTGSFGRIGYALSLHRDVAQNDIHARMVPVRSDDPGEIVNVSVGSDARGDSALVKGRYAFGVRPSDGYAQVTVRDARISRDESAALTSALADGTYLSYAGSSLAAHSLGIGFDTRVPLGARDAFGNAKAFLTYRHYTSVANQSVAGPFANAGSSYFFDERDAIGDDSLAYERTSATTDLSLQAAVRSERLAVPFASLSAIGQSDQARERRLSSFRSLDASTNPSGAASGPASTSRAQMQRSYVARYTFDAAPRLHATFAAYASDFSTFGRSLDPRVGLVWTPDTRSAVRASFGTTFQSPSLTALYVPAPLPDASDRIVHIGNPRLRADRATEYDLGAERALKIAAKPARLSLDLYRTNLRTPAQTYVPSSGTGYAYPINIGGAVYQGLQAGFEVDFARSSRVSLGYSIDNAYPTSVPPEIATGSLVAGRQFLGVPLQRAHIVLEREAPLGFTYDLGGTFEGHNNELNRPPFLTLDAGVGYGFAGYRLDLAVQNLTNVYANAFTQRGGGVPYVGANGPIPLDAYALPPSRISASFSRRF